MVPAREVALQRQKLLHVEKHIRSEMTDED